MESLSAYLSRSALATDVNFAASLSDECMRAVVTIVAAPEHSSGIGTLEWPDGISDPFAQFISMCR